MVIRAWPWFQVQLNTLSNLSSTQSKTFIGWRGVTSTADPPLLIPWALMEKLDQSVEMNCLYSLLEKVSERESESDSEARCLVHVSVSWPYHTLSASYYLIMLAMGQTLAFIVYIFCV